MWSAIASDAPALSLLLVLALSLFIDKVDPAPTSVRPDRVSSNKEVLLKGKEEEEEDKKEGDYEYVYEYIEVPVGEKREEKETGIKNSGFFFGELCRQIDVSVGQRVVNKLCEEIEKFASREVPKTVLSPDSPKWKNDVAYNFWLDVRRALNFMELLPFFPGQPELPGPAEAARLRGERREQQQQQQQRQTESSGSSNSSVSDAN